MVHVIQDDHVDSFHGSPAQLPASQLKSTKVGGQTDRRTNRGNAKMTEQRKDGRKRGTDKKMNEQINK